MKNNGEYQNGHGPSAAEMMDYVQKLAKINFDHLGDGWFVSGTGNETGSDNPTVTLSKKDERGGLTHRTVPWQEFKSWQE